MMRSRLFLPPLCCLALLALGQGCPGLPNSEPPQADRLAITAELQEACRAYTDAQIHAWLTSADTDRLNGYSLQDARNLVVSSCTASWAGTAILPECTTCGLAAVQQVYTGQ